MAHFKFDMLKLCAYCQGHGILNSFCQAAKAAQGIGIRA